MTDLLDDILPVEPTAEIVSSTADFSTDFRRITPLALRDSDRVALDQLTVLMKMSREDVIGELLRRAAPSNGVHGYEVACFGCGTKFTVKRRPAPGRHSWCDTCKANGEPAAQRARDYRERRSSNV